MESAATFSVRSDAYAQDRPRYPDALFDWLAENSPGRAAAWDCATGNGQAAIALARRFERVEASDVSPAQIGQAFAAPNIRYSVQPAERTGFPDAGFDLITVAQALHWFDYGRFWAEVRRTARPGGLFCAWGYAWFDAEPETVRLLTAPIASLLEPFWAPNNGVIWRGYRSEEIAFPFARIAAPRFDIEVRWTRVQVLNYVRTWSAYKRALEDPATARRILALEQEAGAADGADEPVSLRMPLVLAAGRVA